jgi:4-alpha-glucanotransferase
VLAFEREDDGSFRAPDRLSARALASANTHDLAPLAGHLAGRDLTLRAAAGETAAPAARRARDAEREALVARLRSEGLWSHAREPEGTEWCRATAALLARAPAPLVAVSLDDLVGESEPVHLPGIAADRHPSWRRRMREPLERIVASEAVREALPLGTFGSRAGARPSARRHRGEEEA